MELCTHYEMQRLLLAFTRIGPPSEIASDASVVSIEDIHRYLRIEQSNVPDKFRMPVFVRLDFGDGRWSRQRVWVTGKVTEVELPLSPLKPTDLHFNDLESVLCEVAK
jgi:hypothetical protein